MQPNPDFLSEEDVEKIISLSKQKELYLYQIGQICGIKDKGFWSKIMKGKKPIPEHARKSLRNFFIEGAKDDKETELCK